MVSSRHQICLFHNVSTSFSQGMLGEGVYRLLKFKMSACEYEAPMTLRSGVLVRLWASLRWLLAELVRQKGDAVLCGGLAKRVHMFSGPTRARTHSCL